MTTETTSPEGGAMTREQAVAAIKAADAPVPVEAKAEPAAEPEAAAEPEEQQSEAAPTAEDEGDPEAPAIADEDAEPSDPEPPAITYPRSWDAEERAEFAKLPEEARTIILAREETRDRAVSKAQQEAANARKAAEAEAGELTKLKPQLASLIERGEQRFQSEWDNIDWPAWFRQDPGAAGAAKFQMDQEKAELVAAQAAQQELTQKEIQKFVSDEFAKLSEVAPDLVDPKEGKKRRGEIANFLLDQGVISHEQLVHVSAVEMSIARDAMLYREMKKAPPTLKPTSPKPATTPPAKPAAAVTRSPANDLTRLENRFAQTKSRADAAAIIRMKGL